MKRFVSVVNNTVPFGRALNAIAHTSVGIGHRLPDGVTPSIEVFFTDSKTLYDFRQEVHRIISENVDDAVCSEFTNTMIEGGTEQQLAKTKETREEDLTYYTVSVCMQEDLFNSPVIQRVFKLCTQLKGYNSYTPESGKGDFALNKKVEFPDYRSLPAHKIAMVLNRSVPVADLVNALIKSSLAIGQKATLEQLRLLVYVDASGHEHPNISFHGIPIVSTKKQSKFKDLAAMIEKDENVVSQKIENDEGTLWAVSMLGSEQDVSKYTYQKFISLWAKELSAEDFEKDNI